MNEVLPINDTTYEVLMPSGDKVEIGDRGASDFKPHLKLSRWGGECFIKVGLPSTEKITPAVEAGKGKWRGQKIDAHLYPLEPTARNELGGFEFEIILKEKPATNQIVLDIQTQGLRFSYQPELTDEDRGKTSPEQKFNDEVLPLLVSMNPDSVLDLGGGRGELVRDLNGRGIPSTVFEVSQEAYDNRVTDNFIQGDAAQTPWSFSDKEFDCITGVGFLKYVNEADINNLIGEIVRTSNRAVFFLGRGSYQPKDSSPIVEKRPKEWWANRFADISPDYNVEFYDLVAEKAFRPDNVVGSYAVYHATKKNNEYMTGKAFHIYRPIAEDAVGNKAWCAIHIDGHLDPKNLTITVPQQFLDEAVYPVVIDPDFGYLIAGGTEYIIADEDSYLTLRGGSAWTMPAPGGTANYIRAYIGDSETCNTKVLINQKDSEGADSHGQIAIKENLACGLALHWEEFTLSGETLTEAVVYILSVTADKDDLGNYGFYTTRYDTDGAVASYSDSAQNYGAPENPWNDSPDGTTRDYSIYCNYTEAAPAGLENKSANMGAKMVAAGLI